MRLTILSGLFLAAAALAAACTGGSDREAVTLEEYFARVQALHEVQEQSSEALGSQLESRFSGAESVIEETRVGLDELEPPAEVRDVHADLLVAYGDLVALIDEAADQLERGEAGEEVFQTLLGDRTWTALGLRMTEIANELVSIADAAGITVDLSTGALVADSASPGEAGAVATPRVAVVEPADPLLPPASPTGVDEVDAVIKAVLSRDLDATRALVRHTSTACTSAEGIGGPPKCASTTTEDADGKTRVFTEEDGTLVDVLPLSVCEGEYARDDAIGQVAARLAAPEGGVVERVYAIYRVPDGEFEAPYWPAGEYAVVFANRQDDELWGTTVRIADGGIVRIDFGCGRLPPASMAVGHAGHLLAAPLGALTLGGSARVEFVGHFSVAGPDGTVQLQQTVLDLRQPIGGYSSVLLDANTEVAWADGSPATLEEIEPGQLIEVTGVPLPWQLLRAERVVIVPPPSSGLPGGAGSVVKVGGA